MKIKTLILISLLLTIGSFAWAQIPGGFWVPDDDDKYVEPINEYWGIYLPSGLVGLGDSTPDAVLEITTSSGADAFFMVSSTKDQDGDYFIVDASGNVGIGITTPLSKLSIKSASNQLALIDSDDDQEWRLAANVGLFLIEDENTGNFPFQIEAGVPTDTLHLTSAGRVGIGDNTPDAILEVVSQSGSASFMISDGLGGDGDMFIVDSAGNVGIGDSTPSTKLDVNGAITLQSSNSADTLTLSIDSVAVRIVPTNNFVQFRPSTANTGMTVQVQGRGTGGGVMQWRSGNSAIIWQIEGNNTGVANIDIAGNSPDSLRIINLGNVPVRWFNSSAEGITQYIRVYGYRAGDEKRYMQMAVGADAADSVSFGGTVGNFYFDGNIGIGTASPSALLDVGGGTADSIDGIDDLLVKDDVEIDGKLYVDEGVLYLSETTTPTSVQDDGAIYTKNDNELYFQDGAGAEHLLHGDAFSNIWFHGSTVGSMTVLVGISAEDAFTKIDSFTVVGNEDDLSHVIGSTSTDNLTLNSDAGGEYEISYHASVTATGGADKQMMIALGITLATAKDITDVTDNTVTPIVITSASHGLENGDMVEIVGVLGNDAANGSYIVDGKTDNTFKIVTLDGTATTGDGDFNEGSPTGDVTIEYPGNMVIHRMVRGADLGAISATGVHILANSDVLALYVANLDGTTDLTVAAVSFDTFRIGD